MNDSNIQIYAVYKPSNVITTDKFGLLKYYALILGKVISYLWVRIRITANSCDISINQLQNKGLQLLLRVLY